MMKDTDLESGFSERKVVGYCDEWSVAPGEALPFRVSCEPDKFRADIVELTHTNESIVDPRSETLVTETHVSGMYEGTVRTIESGSHVVVPHDPALQFEQTFSIQVLVCPTHLGTGKDGLLTKWNSTTERGYGLFVDGEDCLVAQVSLENGCIEHARVDAPLSEDDWYFVSMSVDTAGGRLALSCEQFISGHDSVTSDQKRSHRTKTSISTGSVACSETPLVIAGYVCEDSVNMPRVNGHFTGKIESPRVISKAIDEFDETVLNPEILSCSTESTIAVWDFTANVTEDGFSSVETVVETGPHGLDGYTVNLPARAVPGHNWTGKSVDFTSAPEEYGAIRFHEDDMTDADWESDFVFQVPEDFDSGAYAARLMTPHDEYFVQFFVRSRLGEATAPIAVYLPTNTYLAYANDHFQTVDANQDFGGETFSGMVPVLDRDDIFLSTHREYGLSVYDTHIDDSGSMFSSRCRPLINVAPSFESDSGPSETVSQLGINVDLYLLEWLETKQFEYDVVTDEDIHKHGEKMLDPYNVVVSGHHPEYPTGRIMSSIEQYQRQGGRFMYLGGNGFYWVTSYHSKKPIIEVRRGEVGEQAWIPAPGEQYHEFTGEKGGLWTKRGWAPQKLVGVGFSGQYEINGRPYYRLPDSYQSEVSFIFQDIEGDTIATSESGSGSEPIGPASGEVDRYDTALGSPEDAYVLATSICHSKNCHRVIEELQCNVPYRDGQTDHEVRSDIVYYRTPEDGGIFSVGSMAWIESLLINGADNSVSQITENVLREFMSDGSLPTESRP